MCELDAIFRALADRQRYLILSCLKEHHTVALADLAELVAEREAGTDVAVVPAERVRDVYLSLYHNHVPRLEEAHLVSYDQEGDFVVRAEGTDSALVRAREAMDALMEAT